MIHSYNGLVNYAMEAQEATRIVKPYKGYDAIDVLSPDFTNEVENSMMTRSDIRYADTYYICSLGSERILFLLTYAPWLGYQIASMEKWSRQNSHIEVSRYKVPRGTNTFNGIYCYFKDPMDLPENIKQRLLKYSKSFTYDDLYPKPKTIKQYY